MPDRSKHFQIKSSERSRARSLVPAGHTELAIDAGIYKRKHAIIAEIDDEVVFADDGDYVLVFTATSDTLDRDSERVLPRSFEQDFAYYEENPVVLFNHDHSIPAVGKCIDYRFSASAFLMEVEFAVEANPLAKVLWGLYSKGYMRMVSVGFIPIEWTEDEEMLLDGQQGVTFTRTELIELSLVNVGANRHAVSALPKSDPFMAYTQMLDSGL